MHSCAILNLQLFPGIFMFYARHGNFFCKMPTFKTFLVLPGLCGSSTTSDTTSCHYFCRRFFSVFLIQPETIQPPLLSHTQTAGMFYSLLPKKCTLVTVLIMNIASCLHVSSRGSRISILPEPRSLFLSCKSLPHSFLHLT